MEVNQAPVDDADEPAAEGVTVEVSRVDEAYQQILLEVVQGRLTGGAELKSTLLARQFKMSRTPVVQALQRLAADGIVTLEINKRAVVRPGAENWLVEIHQLRELLEPTAAALAAVRMPAAELTRLTEMATAAANRADQTWTVLARQFDFALHLSIADHTGNLVLGEAIRKCWSYKNLSYAAGSDSAATLEKGYREHLAILESLFARDAATASAAMQFHLRSAASLRPSKTIV